MMLEKHPVAISSKPMDIGRVIFLPETKQEFLFLIPRTQSPLLKLLEDSMWFKIANEKFGIIYRASASLEALHWLRDNLGQLSLTKEVNDWRNQVSTVIKIQPIQNLPLFDFQREGVGFLVKRPRAMLSFSPGLGKTITSITAASLLAPKVNTILVVAPLSLLYMWKAEIEKWTDSLNEHNVIIYHGPKASFKDLDVKVPGRINWVITNPETITNRVPTFIAKKFHLLILDESILYKNKDSKRTKGIKRLAKDIPYVWQLTGAPANRMLDDIWSQFNILKPKALSSYWRFAKEYCMVNPTDWGNQVIANKLGSEEKIKERFKDIYFARSQDEVLDLPPWIFQEIDIPMTARQEKAYKELSTFLKTTLTHEGPDHVQVLDDDAVTITVDNHLAKVVRLLQLASNPVLLGGDDESGKWQALPDLMEYYPGPYLIWTAFKRTAHMLKDLLERTVDQRIQMLTGDTPSEERAIHVENFQKGREKILILNMQVGSFGHTLTAAKSSIYAERSFDSNYFQSLHRVRRIGSVHSTNILHLRSCYQDGSPTIDHLVHSLLDYRVGMIQNLTTGMLRDIL